MSRAYDQGRIDGLSWDLDGFRNWVAVDRQRSGWDEATINAIGSEKFARDCGIETTEGPEWEQACEDYNRGAYDGACQRDRNTALPQSEKSE